MFEGQCGSSSLTGKSWTGAATNDVAGSVEKNDLDKQASFFYSKQPSEIFTFGYDFA